MPSTSSNKLIRSVMQLYGLETKHILAPSKGYRNTSVPVLLQNGELVNLMLYRQESGIDQTIRRADAVSDFVAERGLPARHTLDPRIACMQSGTVSRCAKLYNYLPGATIPWEAYTHGHLVSLGAALSNLHSLLAAFPAIDLPNVEDTYAQITSRMAAYFSDDGVRSAMHAKLQLRLDDSAFDRYRRLLVQCQALSGRQALHMDFVRGNILFDGTKQDGLLVISGILDFEKTAVGHPLFDVARTLAFLLVDCKYKSSDKVTKYFLQSGYIKRGAAQLAKVSVRTSPTETHDLLALLLDFFLLHDFYKFLRHNPYESLHANEHYVRTVAILDQRNIIQARPGGKG